MVGVRSEHCACQRFEWNGVNVVFLPRVTLQGRMRSAGRFAGGCPPGAPRIAPSREGENSNPTHTLPTMPRVASYANNKCTTLAVYTDVFATLSVELKDAFTAHAETSVGACDFCANPVPKARYMACEMHLACENCHDTKTRIAIRSGPKTGMCKKGCDHMVVFPLVRNLLLEKHVKANETFIEKAKLGLENENTKWETQKEAFLKEKEARKAAEAALARETGQTPAAARTAVANGKRTKAQVIEEEGEQAWDEIKTARRDQIKACKEKKRKLEMHDELASKAAKLDLLIKNGLSSAQKAALSEIEKDGPEEQEDEEEGEEEEDGPGFPDEESAKRAAMAQFRARA